MNSKNHIVGIGTITRLDVNNTVWIFTSEDTKDAYQLLDVPSQLRTPPLRVRLWLRVLEEDLVSMDMVGLPAIVEGFEIL